MASVREFLNTAAGRWTALGLLGLAGLFLVRSVWGFVSGDNEILAASLDRTFICAETGKPFGFEISAGVVVPVRSPHSGRDTGFPAELCYWTGDGRITEQPTPVLLNRYVGKKEPTFCPDCGRLVRPHNPRPQAGDPPPPTANKYDPRKDRGRGDR